MKKTRYAFSMKVAVFIIQQIAIVILAISMVVLVALAQMGGSDFLFDKNSQYTKSQAYSNDIEGQFNQLLKYIRKCSRYETNRVYDPEKLIDITTITGNSVLNVNGQLTYKLSDLLTWYGQIEFDDSGNLIEKALPISGVSQAEYCAGQEDLLVAYNDSISTALYEISADVREYKNQVRKFKKANTNLRYSIQDRVNNIVYTNTESGTEKEIIDLGDYFVLDTKTAEIEGTLANTAQKFYDNIDNSILGQGGNYRILVGINTNFPVEDEFYKANERMQTWKPWGLAGMVAGLVSFFASLACIIYLTGVAGKSNQDGDIHLNWFDQWKLEIAFFTLFFATLGIYAVVMELFMGSIVSFVICCYVIQLSILTGLLSFIRRMRAGTIWKNSIIAALIGMLRSIIKNRRITTRVWFNFIIFLLINIIIWNIKNGIGVLLLVTYNGMVGIWLSKEALVKKRILDGIRTITAGELEYKINLADLKGDNAELALAINNIGSGLNNAVDASLKNERLKADLITNVSHDIRTPLTSIINYVDLLKRENIEDEKIKGYIEILESKSHRLKNLTEDLVEASKVSSGNVVLNMEEIDFVELVYQTNGEFEEKFAAKKLQLIANMPQNPTHIMADGRRLWRVIENLYRNVEKYAMENTRVYVDLMKVGTHAVFIIKNISAQQLNNISADELTERFIRGEVERSTEGSGLGLSIAKDLTELQKGEFVIHIDGDLFCAIVEFEIVDHII